jgi:hypothetical protein
LTFRAREDCPSTLSAKSPATNPKTIKKAKRRKFQVPLIIVHLLSFLLTNLDKEPGRCSKMQLCQSAQYNDEWRALDASLATR